MWQDTMDESNWQNLNKKLHRISSTTDGKYDAKTEIEVPPKSLLFSIISKFAVITIKCS